MPASPRSVPDSQPTLLVADSFRARVSDGTAEVRGFAHHLARFRAAALAAITGLDGHVADRVAPIAEGDLDAFITSARIQIADDLEPGPSRSNANTPAALGSFPRLELWRRNDGGLRLSLVLRPLPDLRDEMCLLSARRPVSINHASVKGPNIAVYAGLASRLGGEALLLDDRGRVIEGTTTSLLWWQADGQLGYSAATERVPSVAEHLVREIARRHGVKVRAGHTTPAELHKHDLWAVNALHGIRTVLSVDGVARNNHDPDRLARYRAEFDATWTPVRGDHP